MNRKFSGRFRPLNGIEANIRGACTARGPASPPTGPRVFAAAAAARVAIEIDGDPARQDLDCTLAREALKAGCVFALDSDAYAAAELSYAETAIAHARLAAIPASQVINCWPLDRLLAWAAEARTR